MDRAAERWSLRLRISLFFALLFVLSAAAVGFATWVGWNRLGQTDPTSAFVTTGVLSVVFLMAVVAWIWRLFDEFLSIPLQRMASDMRARVHAGVDTSIDRRAARYLGDLAPALSEMQTGLSDARRDRDAEVARRTASLEGEVKRLAAILWDTPTAILVCTPSHRVALYNKQALALTDGDHALGLDCDVREIVETDAVDDAYGRLRRRANPMLGVEDLICRIRSTGLTVQGRLRLVDDPTDAEPGYLLTLHPVTDAAPAAPAVARRDAFYDFRLIDADRARGAAANDAGDGRDVKLADMRFVVFDTETTGLEPHRGDEIVQIAGVRIVAGRVMADETFDTLVDPERRIPEAATAIHGLGAADVAGAPTIDAAGRRFLRFCGDAALIAHNAPFDLAFFAKHADRIGARIQRPVLDTALMSTLLFPPSAGHTLDDLAERLDVAIPDALRHTALGDAMATAEVAVRLFPMLDAAGFGTLRALQAAPTPKKLAIS